jgi:y4mF family transcriptional regulator
MKLNEFVKFNRNKMKMNQAEMALKCGVGLRFLRELEQGKKTLRLDKVNQVLNFFGYEVGPIEIEKMKIMNHQFDDDIMAL